MAAPVCRGGSVRAFVFSEHSYRCCCHSKDTGKLFQLSLSKRFSARQLLVDTVGSHYYKEYHRSDPCAGGHCDADRAWTGNIDDLIGLIMMDIPGKRPLEAKLIKRPAIVGGKLLGSRYNKPL